MRVLRNTGMLLALFAGIVTLFLSTDTARNLQPQLYAMVLENYVPQTGAQNSVASIYLNYRVFDTIFEALMLLVSVMGVIHFSRHEHGDEHEMPQLPPQNFHLGAKSSVAIVIPMIIMLGIYLIVNGHNTPGGGFQGGAALSSAFICVYLIRPEKVINFYSYERMEKYLFILIALTALVFAVSNLYLSYPEYNIAYLLVMNILIGLKVFCGLTIVFYRFVHYEDT